MLNPHDESNQAVRGIPYLHITMSSIISSMTIQLLSTLIPTSTKIVTIPTTVLFAPSMTANSYRTMLT